MIRVKNNKASADTWCGMMIEPAAYYELEQFELSRWQNNSKVLTDIGSGDLIINDGTSDIVDVATAINYLKQITDKFDPAGYKITAPTFEDLGGMTTVWKGNLYTAPANSLSIFDEEVTSQRRLREGRYKLMSGGTVGDYIECSIVDKNDVLGLFATFGLTVGVDVLELKKYIRTNYVSPADFSNQEFKSNAASELTAGLFIRVGYYNSGGSDAVISVTKKYHEN